MNEEDARELDSMRDRNEEEEINRREGRIGIIILP